MGLPALRPMQASRWFALQKIRHRETGCKPVHENHAVMTEVEMTWLENGRACPPVCLATPGFPGSPTICQRCFFGQDPAQLCIWLMGFLQPRCMDCMSSPCPCAQHTLQNCGQTQACGEGWLSFSWLE